MRAAVLASLLLLPLAAAAQVYTWKDASGKIHYGDRPPTDTGVTSRRVGVADTGSADSAAARKALADKRMENSQKSKEAADKAAQADKDSAAEAQRQRDCERARTTLQALESGQIRYRLGPDGEREALEDEAREAELSNARRVMEANCGPRPAQPAAPARKPGY